jgi:hypothetical protein
VLLTSICFRVVHAVAVLTRPLRSPQVADDGLLAKTITQATNTKAGCVNGMDANGNPCVTKQKHDPICKVRLGPEVGPLGLVGVTVKPNRLWLRMAQQQPLT